jgi:hypothetical protein
VFPSKNHDEIPISSSARVILTNHNVKIAKRGDIEDHPGRLSFAERSNSEFEDTTVDVYNYTTIDVYIHDYMPPVCSINRKKMGGGAIAVT